MLLAAWPLLSKTRARAARGGAGGHGAGGDRGRDRAPPGVAGIHDLHVWEIGTDFPALSAHVLVARDEDCHRVRRELEQLLHERFDMEHTTLQVEHTAGPTPLDRPLAGRPEGPLKSGHVRRRRRRRAEATRPHDSYGVVGPFLFLDANRRG